MNVTYYLEKTTMVTKLKDLRMKRNASLINEEDDRLRKPQHLSKTESDVLLYILESDDAKKLEIKDPIIYYFEKKIYVKAKTSINFLTEICLQSSKGLGP